MIQRIYTLGKQGKYIYQSKGVNILRPAKLHEVVPESKEYYMRPLEDNKYYLMAIPKQTEYETIKILVASKYIWVKNEKYVRKEIQNKRTQLRTQSA